MNRPFVSKHRYILAFIIGTAVFVLIFLLSLGVSYIEFQRVSQLQFDTSYHIFETSLKHSFFETQTCSLRLLDEFTQSLAFQGSVIDDLEKKLGKLDPSVIEHKKFYTLVELEHFQFVREMGHECNQNFSTILFFYSNVGGEDSQHVGDLLDALASQPNRPRVYSFDVDLDSDLVRALMDRYNVSRAPTLVVNERHLLEGVPSFDILKVKLNA